MDVSVVDGFVARFGQRRNATLALLQAVQTHYRYLPEAALRRVCDLTGITPAQLAGVASFYKQFRMKPVGRHLIRVCHGTACHVAGAPLITESLRRHLGLVAADQDTTADRYFTVEKVACFGCCSLAPVVKIDEETYGHLNPETAVEAVEAFRRAAERPRRASKRDRDGRRSRPHRPSLGEVRIGLGSCCMASGSLAVKAALEQALGRSGVDLPISTGACVGMCHRAPLMEFFYPSGRRLTYGNVRGEAVEAIVRRHLAGARLRRRGVFRRLREGVRRGLGLLLDDAAWAPIEPHVVDPKADSVAAFMAKQRHIVLEHAGQIDPLSLDEYRRHDGYRALETVLKTQTPEALIETITRSGLRGRGGAGFPTGRKWAAVRQAPGDTRFLVMNGDEGDPGAFMDRMMLESYPHRVLEGIAIGAFAVGASKGYLYIRAEYPLALERVRHAIAQAEAAGLLGDHILGTAMSLHLEIVEGAGAFVCGEETGLIASIEGRRGMPRFRPPYPAQQGLWGQPTLINNVETFANVPWIIRNGPEAFSAVGSPGSRGTKVFALAGRVNRGGLIEVPMGITIREIVEEIGGGVRRGPADQPRKFKAVQIGGPSGGCIPARLGETPIDYEELTRAGAMMGSGGLVVLDDSTCMVEMARYFLEFTQDESCGRCTFCRIGTKRMLEILERLCAGRGERGDIEKLEHLADRVKRTSLCGLGRTAPNPILTTLRYFRDEYEAHLAGRCPAGACRALINYVITDECFGCTICAQDCPVQAIEPRPYEEHRIDLTKCVRCGLCATLCPAKAIKVEPRAATDH